MDHTRTQKTGGGHDAPLDTAARPRGALGLSVRAVAVGLALVPVNAWWITQIEYVRYSDNATTSAIFFNALAVLVILAGLNALVRRAAPGWAWARSELLT
ncbi:MAG: DUF6785 family protein, partial [Armatimonadota bacterium]